MTKLKQIIKFIFVFVISCSCGIDKGYIYRQTNDKWFIHRDSLVEIKLYEFVSQDYDYAWMHLTTVLKNIGKSDLSDIKINASLMYEDKGIRIRSTVKELSMRDSTSKYSRRIPLKTLKPQAKQKPFETCDYEYFIEFSPINSIPKSVKLIYRIDTIEYSVNGRQYKFNKTTELKRKTQLTPWLLRND